MHFSAKLPLVQTLTTLIFVGCNLT